MRSWLFTPGNDRRKVSKALTAAADVIIVDWEDGVPEEQRSVAHELALELLTKRAADGPRLVIRTRCAAAAGFATDLEVIGRLLAAGAELSGILLPKVETVAEVEAAASAGLPIIALVESAYALQAASFLAPRSARQGAAGGALERLALGSLDLLTDMGVSWERDQPLLPHVRARLAVQSRAAGLKPPIDGVYPPLGDAAGFAADAAAARSMGFGGKLLIHPSQIAPANEEFGPRHDEVARAKAVLRAYEEANRRGAGVAVLDGPMIDAPVVEWARSLLARA